MPLKFVTTTGMLKLGVDSVVELPLTVAVTKSGAGGPEFTCANCKTVAAWVDDVIKINVAHASANERRMHRAEIASR